MGKVQTAQKQQEETPGKMIRALTIGQVIHEAIEHKERLSDIAASLSASQLKELIDTGVQFDEDAKILAKRVSAIKELIRLKAETKKVHEILGDVGGASIKSSSSTVMRATKLIKILKKFDKTKLFNALVSVKVGEVKKYFGEVAISKYLETSSEEFGTVSLFRKKNT